MIINKIKRWFQFPPGIIHQDNITENEEKLPENDLLSLESDIVPLSSETKIVPQFKDSDLEFLFHQLLEGVVNGWQQNRIAQFLQKLEPKVTIEMWLEWLQRYRNQLVSSPAPHSQLASKMLMLGDLTASLPFVRAIGDAAYEIGQELLNRKNTNNLLMSESLSLSAIAEATLLLSNYQLQIEDQPLSSTEQSQVLDNLPSSLPDNPLSTQDEDIDTEYSVDPAMIMAQIAQETNSETTPLFSNASYSLSPEDIFGVALEKAEAGDLDKALVLWQEVVELDPNFAPAWHNLGSAFAYLNRLTEAIECFDKALAISINDYLSWNDRGNALFRLQRWQEAIISWDRVIGIQPDFEQAWYHRGLALEKLEQYAEAMTSFKRCLSINPEFTQAQKRYQKIRLNTVIVRAGKRQIYSKSS